MSASSNALEASIPAFAAGKEGDVLSSPSPLSNSKRSANRYLFAVGKPLLFASPVHLLCCNERFQQRAGSINRCVFSCKRGRRCLVAFSACKQLKIGKQGFCLPWVKCCPFASPLHIPSCNKRFQRRAGSLNRCVFSYRRGRRCLVALSACKHLKIGKQAFCLPWVKCSHRIPSPYTELQ